MHAAPTIAPATPPATTAPQHMRALERANQVRLARAALKRAVASGKISVAELVLESPWEVESMTISELLRSQSRWGRTRARKFLSRLGLSENKPVGSLTQRQRRLLSADLDAKRARGNGHRELVATV
jgi:hypothetical protein